VVASVYAATAKTTYIPTYRSYIHIVSGSDTTAVSNNLTDLRLVDESAMFCISIEHEDVSKEKVKSIKRAKMAAGWATFATVMSSVSSAFSENNLQFVVRSTNTMLCADLADFYVANAKTEETLTIRAYIDNTTDGELMVNDMERGLTWYILPKQTLILQMHNPDVACLRISDPKNSQVKYAAIAAGSIVKKWEIGWEDDNCWIVAVYKEMDTPDVPPLLGYKRIRKYDFTEEPMMSIDDFYEFKRSKKKK
jgi:hypothetical protein